MPAWRKVDSYKEKGDSLTAKFKKTISYLLATDNSPVGFTLIELMVTIAIIAILAAVGMVVYSTAQKSGRVSKRIQDLKAVQTALESYFAANNTYPVVTALTDTGWRSECSSWGGHASNNVVPGLVPAYMAAFPRDPAMNAANSNSCYVYRSNGRDYKFADHVIAELSQTEYASRPDYVDPLRDGGPVPDGSTANLPNVTPTSCNGAGDGTDIFAWSVYSGGARCW